ncbi:MAG: hypothetical protein AAGA83_00315 [Cyanobacteria bacterium P01_F01_bin.116]
MATPQRITVSNFSTLLVQSTQARSGTPDGNIFFDATNGLLQIITAEELAQVDLGSGLEANPLTNALGIELRALYAFERQERRTDENLREVLPFIEGSFKFAGAYELINGRKLDTANSSTSDDRTKIRGSGMVERAANNAIDRIYIGVRSLNNIESGSQPFYQLATSLSAADRQSAAPVNFARTGPIDEMVQVFGTTANGDAGAGTFDSTAAILIASVRTFGENFGSATSTASGVGELNGFSAGFGVGESPNVSNSYTLADVFGGAAVAPWSTMTYENFPVPQVKAGFVSGSASFSDVVSNPANGSLQEIRAFLDALMLQDTDQDAGAGTFLPKRAEPLYTIDPATGNLITRQGLFLDNLSTADRQLVVMTDNAGTAQTYPFDVDVRVTVDTFWANDANGWYHAFISDGAGSADFNTTNAVTLNDASGTPVKGTSADVVSGEIRFSYAYDSNTQAGLSSGVDRVIVFLAEGDGGAAAGIVTFTITRDSIVRASVVSGQETNI